MQTTLKFNKTNNKTFYRHNFVGSRLCLSFCEFFGSPKARNSFIILNGNITCVIFV